MPPRRKVTTFNKARAIAWLQDGVSKREVGRRLGVSLLSWSGSIRSCRPPTAFWRGPGQDGLRRQHSVKIASSEDKLCSSEAPLQISSGASGGWQQTPTSARKPSANACTKLACDHVVQLYAHD
ncbi:hypothetical protein V1264_004136 [Littorina saxatilis]|uniref:Uncharacterized protein n=1 Tax=Littorina saxatilis TaxID=31220 RepID=A0AAN9G6V2_9CAEN